MLAVNGVGQQDTAPNRQRQPRRKNMTIARITQVKKVVPN
jgi:hypothetical protein